MTTLSVFEVETNGKLTRRYLTEADAVTFCRGYGEKAAYREVQYQMVPGSQRSLQDASQAPPHSSSDWMGKTSPTYKLIAEFEDRYRSEADDIRDAVDSLIDLEIRSQSAWTHDEKGERIPLPESEARQFRVNIQSEYTVDVTGGIREQTAEALQALAADLMAAAERLEGEPAEGEAVAA